MRIYAGNLDFDVTEGGLQELFGAHGLVESVAIMRDRDTHRSKGFAFIDMPSIAEAQAAIQSLNQTEFHQRTLTVNEARPREERSTGASRGFRPGVPSDRGRSTPRGARDFR